MNDEQMNLPSSQGQALVSIDKWGPDYWSELDGGDVSGDSKEVWSGGALYPDHIPGRPKTSNLILRKPYKPGLDKARVEAWAKQVLRLRATITMQDTDADLVGGPYGPPRVYPNALLVKLKMPQHKAGSSDANMIETEWAVSGLA